MNTEEPVNCHRCDLPIPGNMEVFLNKEPFHAGCAVAVAKERKNGRNAHDAQRSEESDAAGVIRCRDSAGN